MYCCLVAWILPCQFELKWRVYVCMCARVSSICAIRKQVWGRCNCLNLVVLQNIEWPVVEKNNCIHLLSNGGKCARRWRFFCSLRGFVICNLPKKASKKMCTTQKYFSQLKYFCVVAANLRERAKKGSPDLGFWGWVAV